jgi:hypothetical protein
MTTISEFYLSRTGVVTDDAFRNSRGCTMTCPDCGGFGFVAGELAGGRAKCLRCDGSGRVAAPQLGRAAEVEELEALVAPTGPKPKST